VMRLPNPTHPQELRKIAECAGAQGLVDKLCLIASLNNNQLSTTISSLQSLGLRTLLDNVGATSRFCDMTDHAIDGVMIDPQLTSDAMGDPSAASILDAIVALATNMGIKTFANNCRSQSEFDFATGTGISYVTYGQPFIGHDGNSGSETMLRGDLVKQWIASR